MKTRNGINRLDVSTPREQTTVNRPSTLMHNPTEDEVTKACKHAEYTATISRNFRDTNTGDPKVLLRDVRDFQGNLFRDHCWVSKSLLDSVIPRNNRANPRVSFLAKAKQYKTYGPEKVTLTAIEEPIILK
jgi:hypothetical protein